MFEFQCYKDQNIYPAKDFKLVECLKETWDELHTKTNIFRYTLGALNEKVVGCYVLQLNHDRGVKRRQPENMTDIRQPFDKMKFNFTKISDQEIIFRFWEKNKGNNIHTILVNVSPINQHHSLLCPLMNEMLPQLVTLESLKVVLNLLFMTMDRDIRIAFNSLCALASVNHLHYHFMIEKQTLPVETVKCSNIKGPLWMTENYPIPAFCFDASSVMVAVDIFKLLDYFLNKSIAHNIFISRGCPLNGIGDEITRVFVWARKSTAGVKQLDAFNVAALELSGLFAVYSPEDFENLEVKDLERELTKWKLDNFEQLCQEVEELF